MKKVMLLASEDMCDILQQELNNTYITLPCYDPAVGSRLFQQNPDFLILDLFLPGADGLAFLKENVSRLPSIVVVLSRFISDPLLQELCALGVSSVILIPCKISYLKELMENR